MKSLVEQLIEALEKEDPKIFEFEKVKKNDVEK
jgi:hypothetical protein